MGEPGWDRSEHERASLRARQEAAMGPGRPSNLLIKITLRKRAAQAQACNVFTPVRLEGEYILRNRGSRDSDEKH